MFSENKLEGGILEEIFEGGRVGKVWRKVWKAYPVLGRIGGREEVAEVRLDVGGLYYVNGFERLVSTMETEVSGSFFGRGWAR